LSARGVAVSEAFHYADGVFRAGENARLGGRDPQGRSYLSFASFEDPDGNGWLLQEIQIRLPGREWKLTRALFTDVATLVDLLRETAGRHDRYEKTHAEHHWWDWYAPYLSARQNGGSQEEAAAAANRYGEGVLHVPPR
jgi:hypothetical protein